jgi:hypothetical protein
MYTTIENSHDNSAELPGSKKVQHSKCGSQCNLKSYVPDPNSVVSSSTFRRYSSIRQIIKEVPARVLSIPRKKSRVANKCHCGTQLYF